MVVVRWRWPVYFREFEEGYLELLRRQFGTKRVNANNVYQEYIAFKEHLHMNATQWETLTDFVKHLGREGKCTVDETEKGWFVTYIDRWAKASSNMLTAGAAAPAVKPPAPAVE